MHCFNICVSWCNPDVLRQIVFFSIIMFNKEAKYTNSQLNYVSSVATPFTGGYFQKTYTGWVILGFNSGSTSMPTTKLSAKCQIPAHKRDFADSREHQGVKMLLATFRTLGIYKNDKILTESCSFIQGSSNERFDEIGRPAQRIK